ncbi:tRNA(Met) cytidine acetyltransferase [Halostella sp. JP-L12]|uniref:tRNA(Met) cytidine acetyltransferase TmcA n=1 Tax=Halostella TaxID=1843185 RepID=UPI000EF83112|nr:MULTISPECIES: tRNA(Met) cytidine acetyltransferase TmcA [Halostella]NHN48986.1 tRNA(Met) cytidine acetyltransferase [Halostella sp. JP-L12]
MNAVAPARSLRTEARRADERRMLVLTGDHAACYEAAEAVLDGVDLPLTRTTLVGPDDRFRCEHLPSHRAGDLLGETRDAVVVDAHEELRPNAVGRVVGAVDGGGLFVLLAPPLDEWPDSRDCFDESLAVPPFGVGDVTGHFRERFVRTLRQHPGIAVYDVDADRLERDGLTDPAPRLPADPVPVPADGERAFPRTAYEACLTTDQADAVRSFEALREPGTAVVAEADRGRGKSSAAGLAAGALALAGDDVLVTARQYRSAREAFLRARELLDAEGALAGVDRDPPQRIEAAGGGCVRFARAVEAADLPGDPGVVIVDEAAALPVRLLESFLAADRVAFATTVHGYEGAGRGFSVRFRDRLAESGHEVTDVRLDDPIRYAGGDPVEVWAFRALMLDARPPVDPLVADATPESVEYEALTPEDLLADEHLLREAFGLLVLAHYRTEPNDLARLLDAPNLSVRALTLDGHVVSVALLAREGDLPADVRREMYEGGRVRGNMVPDVLTSQLRDEDAGRPAGLRVVRIAAHHAVRSRGLGSRLLDAVREEFADLDYLSVGYGAAPGLVDFWRENGYSTVHLSTTRNDASGEYSAVMVDPLSAAGRDLRDRHAARFVRRIGSVLSDALDDADPDVVRAALRAAEAVPDLDLTPYEWRVVADAAYGPGLFDVSPRPFRVLAVRHLVEGEADLTPREERLLVLRALQAREWPAVADALEFPSARQCMRAIGDAYEPLVEAYGDETAREERERFGT